MQKPLFLDVLLFVSGLTGTYYLWPQSSAFGYGEQVNCAIISLPEGGGYICNKFSFGNFYAASALQGWIAVCCVVFLILGFIFHSSTRLMPVLRRKWRHDA